MTEPAPPDDLELRIDALEATVELLIGLLQASHQAGLQDAEARLTRWLRAEASVSGAEPPSREWQVVARMAARLEGGRDRQGDGLLSEA